MRIYPPKGHDYITVSHFENIIDSLAEFELVDIMIALARRRGGTTPLYEAVEQAGDEE